MTDTTNPCARAIMFGGEMRVFNLNTPRVIALVDGDPLAKRSLTLFRRLGALSPLAGQYGNTFSACLKRFEQGVYSVSDVERIIALGLIGAGMRESEAFALLDQHVVGKPIFENAVIAYGVLVGLFAGMTDGKYEIGNAAVVDDAGVV